MVEKSRFPLYGGQAVIEGVMMRGLRQASVAVRHPSGAIVFKHEPLNVQRRRAWENLPFLRGILMLWDALNLGTRALNCTFCQTCGGVCRKKPCALLALRFHSLTR